MADVYEEMILSKDWRKKITRDVFDRAYDEEDAITNLVDQIEDIEDTMEDLDEESEKYDRLDVKLLRLYTSLSSKLKDYHKKSSTKTNRKSLASAISKRIEKADADTDMISDFANAYENISSDLWDLIDLMKTIEKDSANREYKDTAVKAAKMGKEFAKICETLHDFSEKHRR